MFFPNSYFMVLWVIIPALLIPILCILWKLSQRSITPGGIPWLFHKKGSFAQALERFLSIDPTRSIQEGYSMVSYRNDPSGDHRLF
jgi:hypothetical protein